MRTQFYIEIWSKSYFRSLHTNNILTPRAYFLSLIRSGSKGKSTGVYDRGQKKTDV